MPEIGCHNPDCGKGLIIDEIPDSFEFKEIILIPSIDKLYFKTKRTCKNGIEFNVYITAN